jgi:hypothetical protein
MRGIPVALVLDGAGLGPDTITLVEGLADL